MTINDFSQSEAGSTARDINDTILASDIPRAEQWLAKEMESCVMSLNSKDVFRLLHSLSSLGFVKV